MQLSSTSVETASRCKKCSSVKSQSDDTLVIYADLMEMLKEKYNSFKRPNTQEELNRLAASMERYLLNAFYDEEKYNSDVIIMTVKGYIKHRGWS